MIMWTDIGVFAATLLWLALLIKLTRSWLPNKALFIVLLIGIVSAMIPFNSLVIGGYIFALTSYLSIASMLLLLIFLLVSILGDRFAVLHTVWMSQSQWFAVTGFFAITGLVLYPLAGGLTMFDPYRLGYADRPLSILLCLYLFGWALLCVVKRWYLLLVLLITSVLAYYLKLLPSLNLWDYVIDPLVTIFSLFIFIKCGFCRLFKLQPSN